MPSRVRKRMAQFGRQMQNSAQLDRYRLANRKLSPPRRGEKRVVFIGDSGIEFWNLSQFFPRKPYINRGIDRQTTSQVRLRFQQDAMDLQPSAVVILAGSNDIAGYAGPIPLERIEANMAGMAEIAKTKSVRVVFASLLPARNDTKAGGERPTEEIIELNRWMQNYCALNDCVYADCFSALADETGMLKAEYSSDGLNLNPEGYKLIAPITEHAIQQALR